MKTENNKIDFLEYELDGMNTIGILNGSLFYESESYAEEEYGKSYRGMDAEEDKDVIKEMTALSGLSELEDT